MRLLKLFVVILGISSCLGCTKILDYVVDFPGEQLVVIGTISPVSGAAVHITKSISPSGAYEPLDDLKIEDAQVSLYQGDTLVGLLQHVGAGLYKSTDDMSFRANESYWLTAEHEVLGKARSEEILIPAPIQQFRASFEFTGALNSANKPEAKLMFSLLDQMGENHYIVRVRPNLPGAHIFTWFEPFGLYNFEACAVTPFRFSDICFDGDIFEIGLLFGVSGKAYMPSGEEKPYNSIVLSVASISPEYDHYLSDRMSLETPYGVLEPGPTFSNIKGGLGVFMALNEKVKIFGF